MGKMARNHTGMQRSVRIVSPCYENSVHLKSNRGSPEGFSTSITFFDFHLVLLLLLLCALYKRGQKGKQADQL